MVEHILETPADCDCGGQTGNCPVCVGGLGVCKVCGKAEAELDETPECPGPKNSTDSMGCSVDEGGDPTLEGLRTVSERLDQLYGSDKLRTDDARQVRRIADFVDALINKYDDWQSMETAPTDGTQFLATLSNGNVVILSDLPNCNHYSWYKASCSSSIPVTRTFPEGSLEKDMLLAVCWKLMPEPGTIS